MLPVDRQKAIKEMVRAEKTVRINEISERLNVSEMTIYRDIKPLIEEGIILKTTGGIMLSEKEEGPDQKQGHCIYCHKTNPLDKTTYHIILLDGKIETACCAHCGLLRHRQVNDKVSHAICHDFLLNTTIVASSAWYVMDTTLNLACCQPQVLVFDDKINAEKFVEGFEGHIYNFQNAMEKVYSKMFKDKPACHENRQE